MTALVAGPDLDQQTPIDSTTRRFGPVAPRVEPTRRDLERRAHDARRIERVLLLDPLVLHRWPFAKNAETFSKKARSRPTAARLLGAAARPRGLDPSSTLGPGRTGTGHPGTP